MLEKEIQKRFFKLAINKSQNVNSVISIYQELIWHRFDELLSESLPESKKLISEKKWNKLIASFILSTPQTFLIWQITDEFVSFVNKNKEKHSVFSDMLYYENAQILCYQALIQENENIEFNFDTKYYISKSAKILKLAFRVHDNNKKSKTFLLLYRNEVDDCVNFIEITEFMYEFLYLLSGKTLNSILKKLCKKYKLEFEASKEVILNALNSFYKNGIITAHQ